MLLYKSITNDKNKNLELQAEKKKYLKCTYLRGGFYPEYKG